MQAARLQAHNQIICPRRTQILYISAHLHDSPDADVLRQVFICRPAPLFFQRVEQTAVITHTQNQFFLSDQNSYIQ